MGRVIILSAAVRFFCQKSSLLDMHNFFSFCFHVFICRVQDNNSIIKFCLNLNWLFCRTWMNLLVWALVLKLHLIKLKHLIWKIYNIYLSFLSSFSRLIFFFKIIYIWRFGWKITRNSRKSSYLCWFDKIFCPQISNYEIETKLYKTKGMYQWLREEEQRAIEQNPCF